MKRYVLLLALCLVAGPLLADAPPGVVVAHISYLVKVDRLAMIHDEYVREAIIYYLKQNGVPVEHDTFLPARHVDYEYFSSAQGLNGAAGALLVDLLDDGKLHVRIEGGTVGDPKKLDIPAEGPVLPAIDAGLGPILKGQGFTTPAAQPVIAPSAKPSDDLAKTDRLDWTWWDRLRAINGHLALIDSQKATANTYAELAADCALHACYFCRTDEFNCQKYFGKALLYSEVATGAKAPQADAVAQDVQRLAARLGDGFDPSPRQPPFLPEMATLADFETMDLAKLTTYPPVTNLFDYLVRSESALTIAGHDTAMHDFAYHMGPDGKPLPDVLDRGLIWSKPHGDEFDAHLLFGHEPGIAIDDVIAIVVKPDFLPDMAKPIAGVIQSWEQDPNSTLDLLHVQEHREDLAAVNVCGFPALLLAVSNKIDDLAKGVDRFDGSEGLTLGDIDSEIINRNLESAINIDRILLGWGWSQEKAVSYLLDVYGRGRIQAFHTFNGPSDFRPWQILDWAAFAAKLKSDVASGESSPMTYLWSKIDPDLRQKLQGGGDLADADKNVIIATLNSTLSDPQLYKAGGFQSVSPTQYDYGKSFISGDPASAAPEALAEFNRWMWDLGLGFLVTGPDYDSPRPNTAQMQIFAKFDQAADLYFGGHYDASYQVLQPLIPFLERATTQIEYDPGYGGTSQLELLYQAMCRSGRVDDALKVLTGINNTDFAADAFRYNVLRWRRTDFTGIADSFFDVTTNSYRDYQTRTEHAFRIHDYARMASVLDAFHYGDSTEIACQRTLSAILNGKQDDADTWNNFANYLTICLSADSTTYFEDDLHHWVALLDKEFPSNPHWGKLKQDLRLEDWSSLCEAQDLLDGAPSTDDLLKAYNKTKQITAAHVDESNLTKDGLFQKAWLRQQQALGRYILAKTQNLQNLDDVSALQPMVAETVATSHKYAQSAGVAASNVPREAWFLSYMIKFGAPPENVADICHKLSGEGAAFDSGDEIFAQAASHPHVLAALLEDSLSNKSYDLADVPARLDFKADYNHLFKVAIGSKDAPMAVALGRRFALFDYDFHPLAQLLQDSEACKGWIDRNAPTKTAEADWLTTLAQAHDSAGGTVDISQVPDLVEAENK